MIMNIIRPYLDCHLITNQNGFRSVRTTTSQILALRRLIEVINDNNLEAILILIDFKKAFDTVHKAINIMSEDTSAKVRIQDGDTETFSILAGVLQGDTLAHASL